MRLVVDVPARSVVLTLSERNLRTLLNKLRRPESRATILIRDEEDQGWIGTVKAEPDELAYRGRAPGPVDPRDDPALHPDDPDDTGQLKGQVEGW